MTVNNMFSLQDRRQIAVWLIVCCAMIFSMVVLGGVTRLTGSGLSMVEWDPVFGILPPLGQEQWEEVFAKYRESPEYQKINIDMDLAGFKGIFWLEYLHRILGRLIGLVFLIPFLFFLLARKIPASLVPRFIIMFVLGGLQGLMGWYMVKSGLVDNPHVSQYRLTAHLILAVLIYGYILWTALNLLFPKPNLREDIRPLKRYTYLVAGLIAVTMVSGGFMAGLKAGLAYNTFPLMDGKWVPDGLLTLEPWPINLFENITTVQFDHRLLAILTLTAIMVLWFWARRLELPSLARYTSHALLIMVGLQLVLGISTLLLYVPDTPIALASLHQAGALILFTLVLFLAHQLRGLSTAAQPS